MRFWAAADNCLNSRIVEPIRPDPNSCLHKPARQGGCTQGHAGLSSPRRKSDFYNLPAARGPNPEISKSLQGGNDSKSAGVLFFRRSARAGHTGPICTVARRLVGLSREFITACRNSISACASTSAPSMRVTGLTPAYRNLKSTSMFARAKPSTRLQNPPTRKFLVPPRNVGPCPSAASAHRNRQKPTQHVTCLSHP